MSDNPDFIRKQKRLMLITTVAAILIFIFLITVWLLPNVNAQQGSTSFFDLIKSRESCESIRIFGEKAWLPFRLLITHDDSFEATTHISGADKTKESRDVIATEGKFDFLTEEVNTWTIGYLMKSPPLDPSIDPGGVTDIRTFVIEYASEGRTTHKETRQMIGGEHCIIFEITTEEPPELPVIEDYLTDLGISSVKEMQFLVPKIDTLDKTLGRTTFANALTIIAIIGLVIYMFFKAKEFGETKLQTQRQILESTRNSNTQTESAKKAVQYIYDDLIPSIDTKIDSMITKFDLQKNQLLLDIKSFMGSNKLKPDEMKGAKFDVNKKESDAHQPIKYTILNETDLDDNSQFMDKLETDFESKEKPFDMSNIPDIEKIQSKPEEKPKESLSIKDKIAKPFKNVIDISISKATKLPEKFRTSQPIFMLRNKEKIQIDYSEDQMIKPIKLKKLYKGNENKINEALYRKYWKLSQLYPEVKELAKRRDMLRIILKEFAEDYERKRQAEAEIKMKKSEEKN